MNNVLKMAHTVEDYSTWPEPDPLTDTTTAKPYPIDCLPGVIGDAVKEVVSIVKCPSALAANSALSVLATAAQGVANVQPHTGISASPLSIFLLSIGESGERKSTADNLFSKPLGAWIYMKELELELEYPVKQYQAELKAWHRKKIGIERKIESESSRGNDTDAKTYELVQLEQAEPKQVRVPSLVLDDATAEAIGHGLVHQWPCAGLLSSEAGSVFGGHSMKTDNLTNTLSLFNKLWSGESKKVSRRGSEDYHIRNVRLSMGLSVQPAVIREYNNKAGEVARGSGFFARYLMSWPESTQGNRFLAIEELTAKPITKALNQFHSKLNEILDQQYEAGKHGMLENVPVLQLSREALIVWMEYFNKVEKSLLAGHDMESCQDIASKSADNAARLAGLFHLFTGGTAHTEIDHQTMSKACKLANWHLYEARRFFNELALPVEDLAAVNLDTWLIQYCDENDTDSVTRRHIQQHAPSRLRKRDVLNKALEQLEQANRIRLTSEGRSTIIEINPALLQEDEF